MCKKLYCFHLVQCMRQGSRVVKMVSGRGLGRSQTPRGHTGASQRLWAPRMSFSERYWPGPAWDHQPAEVSGVVHLLDELHLLTQEITELKVCAGRTWGLGQVLLQGQGSFPGILSVTHSSWEGFSTSWKRTQPSHWYCSFNRRSVPLASP